MTKAKKVKVPAGYKDKSGHTKVAVNFPTALFKQIADQSLKENKKFSDMVSELCKVGLLDLSESDSLEPKEKADA